MAQIILDVVLVLLFVGIGLLQAYVLFRIKELKSAYDQFITSQEKFSKNIDRARQSLSVLTEQARQTLPDLKKSIEISESLMQDFSFVLARANKKIDLLEELTSSENINNKIHQNTPKTESNNITAPYFEQPTSFTTDNDPLISRLEKMEILEDSNNEDDFLKVDNRVNNQQQDLIDKALREIL